MKTTWQQIAGEKIAEIKENFYKLEEKLKKHPYYNGDGTQEYCHFCGGQGCDICEGTGLQYMRTMRR